MCGWKGKLLRRIKILEYNFRLIGLWTESRIVSVWLRRVDPFSDLITLLGPEYRHQLLFIYLVVTSNRMSHRESFQFEEGNAVLRTFYLLKVFPLVKSALNHIEDVNRDIFSSQRHMLASCIDLSTPVSMSNCSDWRPGLAGNGVKFSCRT